MTEIHIDIKSKTYPSADDEKRRRIISDLRFSLDSNEFVCLVGPSGCGKTTLLNIVAGLDRDFEGDITLGERHASPTIGYVFQNPRLLPWRTVRENIELALPEGLSRKVIGPLLDAMNLLHVQNEYPERLSLGMNRRVAIVRAFAADPDVLLMDEPFVSLDSPTARQVRDLLVELWMQRPHSILFVTHDLREAVALADKLIFLSSSPMKVAAEIAVTVPRSLRNDEAEIESFRQVLLNSHPAIKNLL
ncbi:MAG: ABC transporter ATP-binding protein [Gammaproteobacteria bacterium]